MTAPIAMPATKRPAAKHLFNIFLEKKSVLNHWLMKKKRRRRKKKKENYQQMEKQSGTCSCREQSFGNAPSTHQRRYLRAHPCFVFQSKPNRQPNLHSLKSRWDLPDRRFAVGRAVLDLRIEAPCIDGGARHTGGQKSLAKFVLFSKSK